MTDHPDLSGMLEAERKRLARKPKLKTAEQRNREKATRAWWRNIQDVWADAHLLSDEELLWLAQVTDATRDKPARVSRNPWTGNPTVTRRPTSKDDAVRLTELRGSLWEREDEERRRLRCEGRRQLAERFARLGLAADRYTGLGDRWADLDRMLDEARQGGGGAQ